VLKSDWERRFKNYAQKPPQAVAAWLLFSVLYLPSLFFSLIVSLRRRCYRLGLLVSEDAGVPVVSIGNLAAGGTGKTPVVDWLVCQLQSDGLRVGVISRGYGGSLGKGEICTVSAGDGLCCEVAIAGDEPCLLAKRNPSAIVVTAARRVDAAQRATELGAEVLIMDDGFQHMLLKRDCDCVLLDATAPLGNGCTFPGGLLREPESALRYAHICLLTRSRTGREALPGLQQPLLRCFYQLADSFADLAGNDRTLADLAGKKVVAFAGIAAPQTFFTQLKEKKIILSGEKGFSDHQRYDDVLYQQLNTLAEDADFFITTEKDAVKLKEIRLEKTCLVARLVVTFDEPQQFMQIIRERIQRS